MLVSGTTRHADWLRHSTKPLHSMSGARRRKRQHASASRPSSLTEFACLCMKCTARLAAAEAKANSVWLRGLRQESDGLRHGTRLSQIQLLSLAWGDENPRADSTSVHHSKKHHKIPTLRLTLATPVPRSGDAISCSTVADFTRSFAPLQTRSQSLLARQDSAHSQRVHEPLATMCASLIRTVELCGGNAGLMCVFTHPMRHRLSRMCQPANQSLIMYHHSDHSRWLAKVGFN